jgi:hypothetical protein
MTYLSKSNTDEAPEEKTGAGGTWMPVKSGSDEHRSMKVAVVRAAFADV